MSLTKAQSAAIIAAGLGIETFHHETLGHFNVTALREMIASGKHTEVNCCRFADVRMVDGMVCDALDYLIGAREVDMQRVVGLTATQLAEPLIFVDCPPGANGGGRSQLLVDGIHRLVARMQRGFEGFEFYLVPLDEAPRVDEIAVAKAGMVNVPWGEMEVVPGKGLTRRGGGDAS